MKIKENNNIKSGLTLLNEYAKIFSNSYHVCILIIIITYFPLKWTGNDLFFDFLFHHSTQVFTFSLLFYIPSIIYYFLFKRGMSLKEKFNYEFIELEIIISGIKLLLIFSVVYLIGLLFGINNLKIPFGLMGLSLFYLSCYFPFIFMIRMIVTKLKYLL